MGPCLHQAGRPADLQNLSLVSKQTVRTEPAQNLACTLSPEIRHRCLFETSSSTTQRTVSLRITDPAQHDAAWAEPSDEPSRELR